MTARSATVFAALSAGLAVAAGAFGAHALRDHVTTERLATWETASRYQIIHALAIFLAARWMAREIPGANAASLLFMVGTVLFAGSLYLLVLFDAPWFGAITPAWWGGVHRRLAGDGVGGTQARLSADGRGLTPRRRYPAGAAAWSSWRR